MKKPKPVEVSKTPPPNWPTEKQWKEFEKKLSKSLPTKIPPKNAGPVDRTKYEICAQFIIFKNQTDITQRELSKIIGVTESRVSEILHYHIERFTIDKLITLLAKIKPKVEINIS